MDTPGFPTVTCLPGTARGWEKMNSLPAFALLYVCIISILFKLWVSKWLQHRGKVQDADSRDVVMVTERETGWLETCRQVIKDAQKPGTRVWYCPVTPRQNSNEDETFCPMLVINASNCALRPRDSESCVQLRKSTVCNRTLIHHFPVQFGFCVSVVTANNWHKIPCQLWMTLSFVTSGLFGIHHSQCKLSVSVVSWTPPAHQAAVSPCSSAGWQRGGRKINWEKVMDQDIDHSIKQKQRPHTKEKENRRFYVLFPSVGDVQLSGQRNRACSGCSRKQTL